MITVTTALFKRAVFFKSYRKSIAHRMVGPVSAVTFMTVNLWCVKPRVRSPSSSGENSHTEDLITMKIYLKNITHRILWVCMEVEVEVDFGSTWRARSPGALH